MQPRTLLTLTLLAFASAGCGEATKSVAPEVRLAQNIARGPMGVIVTLKSGDPATVARDHGVSPLYLYHSALTGFAARVSDVARAGLMGDARVRRVSSDQIAHADVPPWGLDRIDQKYLPLDLKYSPDRTGLGVDAYIVDSGIRPTHSDFIGRIGRGINYSDSTGLGVQDTTDIVDCLGHGTHVSGTVGGTNYGVAKHATIHPVRVFPCIGAASYSTVIKGLDWIAANHESPCVVNMSLGGPVDSTLDLAVDGVIASGCAVVVAAGNSNADACKYSPSNDPNAITVGAVDDTDTKPAWSNFGDCVDLFAPGTNVMSAWYTGDDVYFTLSGTSMATPHVTGVAALYLQGKPNASPAEVQDSLKAYSTKGIVKLSLSTNWNLLYAFRVVDNGSNAPPETIPKSPSNLTAQNDPFNHLDSVMVKFTWSDNSLNESGFEMDLWSDEGSAMNLKDIGSGNTSVYVDYFWFNEAYGHWNVRVRAFNSAGNSDWTNTTKVCVPGGSVVCEPPPPPVCRLRGKSGKCR